MKQPTVLFIDDEPRVLRAMQRLLRPHSKVLLAESGLEALEILCLEPVDVIVCDQRMPGMSGTDVLAEARRLSPRSMRILLTGYADLDAAINALNQGHIYRYLSKPWSNEVLIETVQDAARIAMATPVEAAAVEVADEINAEQESPAQFLNESVRRDVSVLVLDDGNAHKLLDPMAQAGIKVDTVDNLDTLLVLLEQQAVGAVLVSDQKLGVSPDLAVRRIRTEHPNVMIIVLAQHADIAQLSQLINAGSIYRFLPHPLHSREILASTKAALARHMHLRSQPKRRQQERQNHHYALQEFTTDDNGHVLSEPEIPKSSNNAELLFQHGGRQSWWRRLFGLFSPST